MIGKRPPKHLKLKRAQRALQVAEGHQLTAGARKLFKIQDGPYKNKWGSNFFCLFLFYSVQGVGGTVAGGDIGGGPYKKMG